MEKRRIECEPIRQTGDVIMEVKVYSGISANMKLRVEPADK